MVHAAGSLAWVLARARQKPSRWLLLRITLNKVPLSGVASLGQKDANIEKKLLLP
jgi:hypothetical protein